LSTHEAAGSTAFIQNNKWNFFCHSSDSIVKIGPLTILARFRHNRRILIS
jgi:hypothetical protein